MVHFHTKYNNSIFHYSSLLWGIATVCSLSYNNLSVASWSISSISFQQKCLLQLSGQLLKCWILRILNNLLPFLPYLPVRNLWNTLLDGCNQVLLVFPLCNLERLLHYVIPIGIPNQTYTITGSLLPESLSELLISSIYIDLILLSVFSKHLSITLDENFWLLN